MHLAAYYFRAHLYTIVPRHLREDLAWMADHGTDAVVLGILEQDLFAAEENLDLICAEADRAGLAVWATPSRWGGLLAGCPKVPGLYAANHPETWAAEPDGSPAIFSFGPVMSVHHPATGAFFRDALERLLARWPFRGVIWDEPKALGQLDHSAAARAALAGRDLADPALHAAAQAAFFGGLNDHLKHLHPEVTTACFVYGSLAGNTDLLATLAATPRLDAFGLDGRPWRLADGGSGDVPGGGRASKCLPDHFPAFREAAAAQGRRSLALIENHALTRADIALMDRRLPEVLALAPDHLLYYYHPRAVEDPDAAMAVIGRHLARR